MKKREGRLGGLVMTLLLLGIGGVLIYGNLFNRGFGENMAAWLVMPWVGAALGAVMIASVVLRWFGGSGRPKDQFINFSSEDGSVGISTRAICDFIERVGKEFSAVRSIQAKLISDRNAVDIQLLVKMVSGNRIPELSQVLQQRVRESVRESLGLEDIRNITIRVQEIVGEPAKSQADTASAE